MIWIILKNLISVPSASFFLPSSRQFSWSFSGLFSAKSYFSYGTYASKSSSHAADWALSSSSFLHSDSKFFQKSCLYVASFSCAFWCSTSSTVRLENSSTHSLANGCTISSICPKESFEQILIKLASKIGHKYHWIVKFWAF